MSLLIPFILCLLTLAMAVLSRRRTASAVVVLEAQAEPVDSSEALLAELDGVRERRRRTKAFLLASKQVIDLADVQVICEHGHLHGFREFSRDGGGAGPCALDSRNLNAPQGRAFNRWPGEGLGWVNGRFGCPTCSAGRFSFVKYEHNDYTTCGHHLVKADLGECPLCAELDRAAHEEVAILSKLERAQFPQQKAS